MIMFASFILMSFSVIGFATDSNMEQEILLPEPIHFLYADMDETGKRDPEDPLIVMRAEDYKKIFGYIPLERMLRTQIGQQEYIVLDQEDLEKMDTNKDNIIDGKSDNGALYKIYFAQVSGTIKDAYIATKANLVNFGKLKEILLNVPPHGHAKAMHEAHDIETEVDEAEFNNHKDVEIKSATKKTDKDMPWMGL